MRRKDHWSFQKRMRVGPGILLKLRWVQSVMVWSPQLQTMVHLSIYFSLMVSPSHLPFLTYPKQILSEKIDGFGHFEGIKGFRKCRSLLFCE